MLSSETKGVPETSGSQSNFEKQGSGARDVDASSAALEGGALPMSSRPRRKWDIFPGPVEEPGPAPDGGLRAWLQVFAGHLICFFLLAQGIVIGLGMGILYMPGLSVPSSYFTAKKPLAVAIVASGAGSGGLVYPAMVQQLLPRVVNQRFIFFICLAIFIAGIE
ncbi:hypothetical protein CHU98_g9622 [Xylaria longipes]|nr:hypothetical protein CHU98_g9622 [Xylaria longipes]